MLFTPIIVVILCAVSLYVYLRHKTNPQTKLYKSLV